MNLGFTVVTFARNNQLDGSSWTAICNKLVDSKGCADGLIILTVSSLFPALSFPGQQVRDGSLELAFGVHMDQSVRGG